MRKFFLINIILLFLCISDTDLVSSNTFHFYDTIKIELVDNSRSISRDVIEIYYSIPLRKEFKSDNEFDSECVVKNQISIYQGIKASIQKFFITSYHSNTLPQILS